ncbi:transcription factor SPT20 homolog [Gigantopelta aegis]|uniref:transcription factor SPT20 homolog n=1 Tax=Gigantopelta aegis TaxID=1735272 RepID=UPI001B889F3A|nr:transcription factor SPT20 homolog [Gigantopelta aegis]
MAGSLDRDVEYAEYLVECSKQQPKTLLNSAGNPGSNKGKSIHQKLLELYIEECEKQPEDKELCYASHILAKLMKREKLNCLILNLYPANEGYSLVLKARNGIESETIKLPYEELELLEYIDAAQLPPFLVDLLEKAQVNFFYSGCIIVEIRDFRRSTSAIHDHDSQYILLKPTPQSLLCDINAITNDGHRWTQDDIFQLESRLLLETEEPLCLDPSPAVLFVNNRLQFDQKQLNNPILKRSVRKYSQAAINKKRKLAQAPAPKELKLFDFLHRKRDRSRGTPPINLKVAKSNVDMWKQRIVQLQPPETIEVDKFAKAIEKPSTSSTNQPLVLVEEHTLERDPTQDHKIMAKITIRQNPVTSIFHGELYLDYNFNSDKPSDGNVCKFTLGSKENVDKYFEQFKELFTEEGRKSVKIMTQKPNQPPSVTYTQTLQSMNTCGATTIQITNAQALLKQQASVAATITTQNEPSVATGLSAKRNVPIQLSLSIGPPGGVTMASNLITSQSVMISANAANTVQSGQILVGQQPGLITGNQTISSAQRLKSFPIHTGQIRATNSPSPVSTPTSAAVQQQILSAVAMPQPSSTQKTPTPAATPTPPPSHSRTPTPTSLGNRRTSGNESVTLTQAELVQPKNNPSTTLTQQGNITTSINIANISGLPQNFSIQGLGLQGVNITNLQGLQNMQVSLTGVSMPGGGIAVPVPITLINTNPSILQNQAGIIVSSLPNVVTAVSSSESAATTGAVTGNQGNESAVTAPHTFVTMVTLPTSSTSGTSSTTTHTTVSSQAIMSTGLASNPTTVLPSSNMLQLPIGLAGNITQLMPMGAKTAGRQATQSLPILQLQGQQGIQLVNVQQQRGQLKAGIPTSSGQQGGNRPLTSTTAVPISSVLTQVSQPLSSHQMTALPVTSLTVGKQGQPGQGQITPQQLLQLAGQHGLQPQQLQTALTFQKPQQTHQPLQFHQLQLKTSAPAQPTQHSSKSKSKKRTTPTPPRT